MKIKEIEIVDRHYPYGEEKDSLYLYYSTHAKDTLNEIEATINRTEALRDLDLTMYCSKIPLEDFTYPQKGKGFELFVDDCYIGDSSVRFTPSIHCLIRWLIDKLLIFKELKAMSEDTETFSSGIRRVRIKGVNTLFEIFINYFYESDRKVNKENKKEFIEIVNKIYKY